jgi:peptidoglycan/LPS O-acetylase OafA/YrhL
LKDEVISIAGTIDLCPALPGQAAAVELRDERPKLGVPARLHLTFIDGMRGCAASYIVFHHAMEMSRYKPTTAAQRFLGDLLGQGHSVVTIFIAISGFCLMLPVARSGLKLTGGARKFFKGRVHRILPPYYIALALSILVIVLLIPAGERLAFLRAPSMQFSIMMHFLLIHNLNQSTFYGINGPLWSVATECQIYLLFPLMILAWRRFGMVWSLLGIFILAHLAFHISGDRIPFNYIFTFALGMAAAVATVERRAERWLFLVCCCSLIGFILSVRWKVVVSDLCIGVLMATLMAILSVGKIAWLRKLLSLRLLTWIGSFSYSLYLIHALLQDCYLSTGFSAHHTGTSLQLIIMFFVVSPINFLVAYLFYFVAEKPFLNRKRRIVETAFVEPLPLQQTSVVNA